MNKRVLIITTRNLRNAPRVIREIDILYKNGYKIWAIGNTPPNQDNIEYIPVSKIKKNLLEQFLSITSKVFRTIPPCSTLLSKRLRSLFDIVHSLQPDIIISHEPDFLPYLIKLQDAFRFRIVYNAHEYHPLEFSDNFFWNLFQRPYYEKIYRIGLPKVDLFINVCQSISDKCLLEYGKESIVIPNAAFFYHYDTEIRPTNGVIKIIHHGACLPGRRIEDMIKIVQTLGSGYHLDLMLTAPQRKYFDEISSIVKGVENVSLIPPVQFDKIVENISKYDIGLYLLPPNNFNNSVALPNKFFEFVQARLCIVIGPSAEMARIVQKYKIGIVSADFTIASMVKSILTLDKNAICSFKKNADNSASVLSAEHYNSIFLSAFEQL